MVPIGTIQGRKLVEEVQSNKELIHSVNVDGRKLGVSYFAKLNDGQEFRITKNLEKNKGTELSM